MRVLGTALLALGLTGIGFAQGIPSLVQAEFSLPRVELGVGETVPVALRISIAPGWHINAVQPRAPFLIPTELRLDTPPGVVVEVTWPAPEQITLPLSQEPLELYRGELEVRLLLSGEEGLTSGTLSAVLRYQACNDEVCVPPAELRLSLPVEVGAAPGPVEGSQAAGLPSPEQPGRGILWGILFAFLLGLGLNLTPCVYPLVPVTVAYFAGGVGRRLLPTLGLALTYLLGIALLSLIGGVYLLWTGRRIRRRAFQLVRAGALLSGIALATASLVPRPNGGLDWVPYQPVLLAQAEAEGQPVILYFSADWCIPCRKLSATTFRDQGVLARLDALEVIPIEADLTWRGGEADELRERFSISGVPTLVFLRGGEEVGRLVGYVSPQEFLEALTEFFPPSQGVPP